MKTLNLALSAALVMCFNQSSVFAAETPPAEAPPLDVPAEAPPLEPLPDDVPLEEQETLDEIEVRGEQEGSKISDAEEERVQAGVTEVISKKELTRLGDSEVSASLKRVSGLSLVGSKFVYVRGLGERFTNVLLNGAQLPSPDPLRRVVPLDLFPNEILEGVSVSKSYQPNLPGEFGGGTIELRSAIVSKDQEGRMGASLGYRDGTTGESGLRYQGGPRDWTGFDKVRELPNQSLVGLNATQLEAFGERLASQGFDINNSSIQPNVSHTLGWQQRTEFDDKPVWLRLGSRYSQTWDSVEEIRRGFSTSSSNNLFVTRELNRERTERNVDLSGLVQMGTEFATGHRLEFTSLSLRQSIDQAQQDVGYTDNPTDISRFSELEWVENRMYAQQLSGSHYFDKFHELLFDWQYTYADGKRDAPNTRRYRYDQVAPNVFEFSRQTDGNESVAESLDDNSQEIRLNAIVPYSFGEVWSANLSSGISFLQRDREADLRRYKFNIVGSVNPLTLRRPLNEILTPANIGANAFQLADVTRISDRYSAEQDLLGAYLSIDVNNYETWRFNGGARVERNEQSVQSIAPDGTLNSVRAEIAETDFLPSLNAIYTVSEWDQLRMSYARTLSRPDFRELSPAPFFDPLLDVESRGNPNLEQSTIDHLDVRFERYLADVITASTGIFYKRIDLPIERVFVPGTGGLLSYDNAEQAKVYGIEFEGFQSLDYYHDALAGFSASGNLTISRSSVDLGSAGSVQTNRNRALQGQSDNVVNLTVSYEPNGSDGFSANLGFNVASARIAQVGVLGLPDIEEEPFQDLSLAISAPLGDAFRLSARISNLLDQDVEFTQGGQALRKYSPGPEASLSVQWRFR